MTYCLAININRGLVFCADSRTNAGTDNIGCYSKTHSLIREGNRVLILLSAGNLATTQSVVKKINGDIKQEVLPNLLSVPDMLEASDYIGMISTSLQRSQISRDTYNSNFEVSFILGGQIGMAPPETLFIYPQGNYIHESDEHPFLQIGEIKYGKPILDRVIKRDITLELAARVALVSMQSTVRSNVTVGPPIELMIYQRDTLIQPRKMILSEDDPFFREISEGWNKGLLQALSMLPNFEWETRK